MKRARHRHHLVEGEEIGDEVVVLDHFALFVSRILGEESATAECDPLHEKVEGLALVGRGLNCPAQFNARDVFEQEDRSGYGAQFLKSKVKLVLARICRKLP